jgi:D-alanyl-D-alanine carboxypeptidase (penicillin-binding protein 5/6)
MRKALAAAAALAAGAFIVTRLVHQAPAQMLTPATSTRTTPGGPAGLQWPDQGQAAIGIDGVGLLGSHGEGTTTPMASLAKLMTAYVVLRDHPLVGVAEGAPITVSPSDVALYRAELRAGYSVVAVGEGEQLSERQALEALLLPSADNIAVMLANWDAGREPSFVTKMNDAARVLGLAHTEYRDASGLDAASVTTASDQVVMAVAAFKIDALRQIVAMQVAHLPVAGAVYNTDSVLGVEGIVGIKTGSTSRAGGCFVFAAEAVVGGRRVIVVGAVLHQMPTATQSDSLHVALQGAAFLVASVDRLMEEITVGRDTTLGLLRLPGAAPVAVTAAATVSLFVWPGVEVRTRLIAAPHLSGPLHVGAAVGTAVFEAGAQRVEVPLVTAQ